jgi:DNA-binding transcriptional ArsR family regulator
MLWTHRNVVPSARRLPVEVRAPRAHRLRRPHLSRTQTYMSLQIHFTPEDLGRVRFLDKPLPALETLFSARMLQLPQARARCGSWQPRSQTALTPEMRPLFDLVPPSGGILPFFDSRSPSMAEVYEEALAYPSSALRHALRDYWGPYRPPGWIRGMISYERRPREVLANAFLAFHKEVVSPIWPRITTASRLDLAERLRILKAHGIEKVLANLHRTIKWHQTGILEICRPANQDIWLNGRGLTLAPSAMLLDEPMVDFVEPVILFYPASIPISAVTANDRSSPDLAALLGANRARVLELISRGGRTTSELARRLGISPASASEHARTLRQARLVTTHRRGREVVHMVTALGADLVEGNHIADPLGT